MKAMIGLLIWVTSQGSIMKYANNYSVLGTACIGSCSCIWEYCHYSTKQSTQDCL